MTEMFKLPDVEIKKLNAVKEALDMRDRIVEGPKNDEDRGYVSDFHVGESWLSKKHDKI